MSNKKNGVRNGQRTQYPATPSDPNIPTGWEDERMDRAGSSQGCVGGDDIIRNKKKDRGDTQPCSPARNSLWRGYFGQHTHKIP